MIKKPQKVQTGDVIQERFQTIFQEWAGKVSDCPLLDGIMTGVLSITTTPLIYKHKLGRKPVGRIIVGQLGYGSLSDSDSNDTTITLTGDKNFMAVLWIF